MNFFQLLILGIVQALLEWLPVSSEGFIILISTNIFQEAASVAFTVAIYFHLGTAIAVVIKYWRTYIEALTSDRTIRLMAEYVKEFGHENLPRHYAFVSLKEGEDRFARKEQLVAANIFPIWYENIDHDEALEALLIALVDGDIKI